MDYMSAREMVALLFKHDQEKAQDLLARCCENKKVSDEILYCVSKLRTSLHQPSPADTRGLATPFVSGLPSLHDLHHPGSPRHEILPRPPSEYPLSPARTARSETSHSTKGETGHKEYIYLLSAVEDGIKEQPVCMRTAPIANSVIRHGLILKSGLDANMVSTEEREVHIPLGADTGTVTAVPFHSAVQLTWRRLKSDMTHNTTFYVVPDKLLDIDILLGYLDSGEDYNPTVVPPPQSHEPKHFQRYNQELRPSAPSPPPISYHRSAETNNGSLRPVSARHQTQHDNQHFYTLRIPEATIPGTLAPNGSVENHHYSHHQPSSPFFGSQPTQFEISQPNPYRATVTTVASTSSVSEVQPDVRSEKLRIAIKWDETRFNMWLNPDAPSEAFFEAFRNQVGKRKMIRDRTMMIMILKEDEETSEEKTFTVPLGEDDLDADWREIMKWVGRNKKKESPHIFGKVHVLDS